MFRLPLYAAAFLIASVALGAGVHNDTRDFVTPMQMSRKDFSDPEELQRTWDAALVRVPQEAGRSVSMTTAELAKWRPDNAKKHPAVVYMHGCSGLWEGSELRVRLMADLGFVTVAPASLARKKYAQSCDPASFRAGLYRDVLDLRQHDAAFALEQVGQLPFVDPDRIILMGFSEGAIVTATLPAPDGGPKIAARIIEGWTCHAGWPEYEGLNAGNEPVLALLAEDDPWFQADWLQGNCGTKMRDRDSSLSIVYSDPALAERHGLLEAKRPRSDLLAFLKAHGLLPR